MQLAFRTDPPGASTDPAYGFESSFYVSLKTAGNNRFEHQRAKLDEIRVLSLGAAGGEAQMRTENRPSPEFLQSAQEIFQLTLNAQEQFSIQSIRELLKGRWIGLDRTASAEAGKEIGLGMASKTAAKALKLMAGQGLRQ